LSSFWNNPSGGSSKGASSLRKILFSLLVGLLSVGVAWAGAGLVPINDTAPKSASKTAGHEDVRDAVATLADEETPTGDPTAVTPEPGHVLAGAAKISMFPRPQDYPGANWETNYDKCKTFDLGPMVPKGDHLADAGSPWNENPDCLYMGGFDIGPSNPISTWDSEDPNTPWKCTELARNADGSVDGAHSWIECGVYIRSFAVKGSNGKTLTMTIIDAEGYLWDYASKCTDCGIKEITADLAAEEGLGLEKEGIIIGATHSHSAPEFLGGWGFVPDWYMTQTVDTIKESVRQAIANMEPAVLEMGEELARPYNNERRDTYRSAEEQQLTWLRAIGSDELGNAKTIATIGAYAAHPTAKGTNGGKASSDWVGVFENRVEERFGGIGLYFMTGLGNMSNSGGSAIGKALADLIPEVGGGIPLQTTDVRYARTTWAHPATNVPLSALGLPGFFDRKFLNTPSEVRTGKTPDTAPCESASPVSVEMAASAARIGDQFAITAAPGEIFSNISNTIKEKSPAQVTMPLAQTGDALGYMPQNFEMSPIGQQGLGFVFGGVLIVNYEDSYSVDHCLGDKVLETNIDLVTHL
jgi:hypothetical protein